MNITALIYIIPCRNIEAMEVVVGIHILGDLVIWHALFRVTARSNDWGHGSCSGYQWFLRRGIGSCQSRQWGFQLPLYHVFPILTCRLNWLALEGLGPSQVSYLSGCNYLRHFMWIWHMFFSDFFLIGRKTYEESLLYRLNNCCYHQYWKWSPYGFHFPYYIKVKRERLMSWDLSHLDILLYN